MIWDKRDFDFPVRFLGINAPEMNEGGGEAREYLKDLQSEAYDSGKGYEDIIIIIDQFMDEIEDEISKKEDD